MTADMCMAEHSSVTADSPRSALPQVGSGRLAQQLTPFLVGSYPLTALRPTLMRQSTPQTGIIRDAVNATL
jgi:hypothetical protein